jgi:transcription antitermination factor NusB
MKGRRRARRAALQALYELDITAHDASAVIAQRIEAMAFTTLTGRLSPSLAAIGRRIVVDHPPFPDAEQVARASEELGLTDAETSALAAAIAELAPQAAYAEECVRAVLAEQPALDKSVARIAPEWPVEQMAPIDRNLLRLALWEIDSGSAPVRVAINEAVELARQFSGEGSRRLVNGALGTYVAEGAHSHTDL